MLGITRVLKDLRFQPSSTSTVSINFPWNGLPILLFCINIYMLRAVDLHKGYIIHTCQASTFDSYFENNRFAWGTNKHTNINLYVIINVKVYLLIIIRAVLSVLIEFVGKQMCGSFQWVTERFGHTIGKSVGCSSVHTVIMAT